MLNPSVISAGLEARQVHCHSQAYTGVLACITHTHTQTFTSLELPDDTLSYVLVYIAAKMLHAQKPTEVLNGADQGR